MNQRELTLWEHLRELRRRLLISVIALVAGTALAFPFWEKILILLARPAQELNDGAGVQLIATQVTEALTTSFKISQLSPGSWWRSRLFSTKPFASWRPVLPLRSAST